MSRNQETANYPRILIQYITEMYPILATICYLFARYMYIPIDRVFVVIIAFHDSDKFEERYVGII